MGAESTFLLTGKTKIAQTSAVSWHVIYKCVRGGGMVVAIDPGKAVCGMCGTCE
jgi:hypothetical protein